MRSLTTAVGAWQVDKEEIFELIEFVIGRSSTGDGDRSAVHVVLRLTGQLRYPAPSESGLAVWNLGWHGPVKWMSTAIAVRRGGTSTNPAGDDLEFAVGGWFTVKGDAELASTAAVRSRAFPGDGVLFADLDGILLDDFEGVVAQLARKVGTRGTWSSVEER